MHVSRYPKALLGVFGVVLAAVTWSVAQPSIAYAGWPLQHVGSEVVLGFGASYRSGERSAQHRGVDLAAEPGSAVTAPLSGHVTFAGRIPGVGGGRVLALTIETARGKVTLLPLASAAVAAGADVAEGAVVGALAEEGDGSSPQSHLHVGVRTGDLYIDPLGVMAPAPAPPGSGQGSGVEVGAGSGVSVGAGAGVTSGVSVPAAGGMPEGVSLAPQASPRPSTSPRSSRAGKAAPSGSTSVDVAASARHSATASGVRSPEGQAVPLVAGPGGVYLPAASAAGSSSPSRGSSIAAWAITNARAYAARTVRTASLVLLGVLGGLAALWPLWRGGLRKDASQLRVRGVGDDVAAAPSR